MSKMQVNVLYQISKDVYEAIEYEKEDGVKAIQQLVSEKYKIQSDDSQVDLDEGVDPNQTPCY